MMASPSKPELDTFLQRERYRDTDSLQLYVEFPKNPKNQTSQELEEQDSQTFLKDLCWGNQKTGIHKWIADGASMKCTLCKKSRDKTKDEKNEEAAREAAKLVSTDTPKEYHKLINNSFRLLAKRDLYVPCRTCKRKAIMGSKCCGDYVFLEQ